MNVFKISALLILSLTSSVVFAEGPYLVEVDPPTGETIPEPLRGVAGTFGVAAGAAATMFTLSGGVESDQLFGERLLKNRQPTNVENQCSIVLNQTCGVDYNGTEEVASFFETLNTAFGSGGQLNRGGYCACLNQNIPHTPEAMNALKTQLKENLRADVNNKIVRDFSLQLEDLHFYWMMPAFRQKVLDIQGNSATEGNFRCLAEEDYKNAINQNPKCQGQTLSDEAKERKIADIFRGFTDVAGGDLQTILSNVKNEVLMTDLKDSTCSSPETYSRVCFDRDRYSLARDAAGQTSDRLFTKMFKNSTFRDTVISRARSEGHSPMEVILEVIAEKIRSKDRDLLELIDNRTIGDSLYRKLTAGVQGRALSDQDQLQIENTLRQVISSGTELHPAFNRLLEDVNNFEDVANSFNGSSLMAHLEQDADKIIDEYRKHCDALINNIAKTVCSTDDELLTSLDEHDLEEYAESKGVRDDQTKNLTKVLACENPNKDSFLKHLLPKSGNSKISDYFAREKNLSSAFDRLRAERFKEGSIVGQTVARAVTQYGGIDTDFFDFDIFDATISESNLPRVAAASTLPSAVSSPAQSGGRVVNEIISNLPPITNDQATVDQPNYSNAMINSGAISNADVGPSTASQDNSFNTRRELREYLRGKAEDEELNNLLDNTDDSLMQELLALRTEMEQNQQRLLELTAENERLKLDTMRQRLEGLQRERSALEPDEDRRQENTVARRDSPLASSGTIGRNLASAPPIETGGSNSGAAATTSGGAGVSAEGASLSGLNRALLSSAGSGASRGPASESSSNPVVVSASAAKSGSLEIRSQEVGLDLLNYLSNNGSDIQTLINLKTSGIIYKYKVLEDGQFIEKEILIEYGKLNEDVQKIIDKKIAQNKDRSKEILRLDNEIKELQRVYSYSALRLLLANQVQSRSE